MLSLVYLSLFFILTKMYQYCFKIFPFKQFKLDIGDILIDKLISLNYSDYPLDLAIEWLVKKYLVTNHNIEFIDFFQNDDVLKTIYQDNEIIVNLHNLFDMLKINDDVKKYARLFMMGEDLALYLSVLKPTTARMMTEL